MTQISKYPISDDIYQRIVEILSEAIAGLSSKSQVSLFFKEFFSPSERIMLGKRLSIGFLLAKGYKYREISKILRVSTTTITTYAMLYKYEDSYRKVVKKILKDEEVAKFWEDIGEKITLLLAKPGSKSGSWVYLKEEIKKRNNNRPF
jgi:uncharacterized protein YerC